MRWQQLVAGDGVQLKTPPVQRAGMAILGNLLQASFKDAVAQADTFLFA